ncbi:uncharacterized protein A4U43_UnF5780 [Asparagus officinalis]|uniref:Uncharacterized protein n=1 Tax=Asparagus officinalis TaxID=4686 RepID=A0A1R3L6M0_ASPOF|nr:uncharacterized protein A4U43_UnF5780 [Asparagus officinalis]
MDCVKSIVGIIKDPVMDIYTTLRDYEMTVENAVDLMHRLAHVRVEMDERISRAEVPGIKRRTLRAVRWLNDIKKLEDESLMTIDFPLATTFLELKA